MNLHHDAHIETTYQHHSDLRTELDMQRDKMHAQGFIAYANELQKAADYHHRIVLNCGLELWHPDSN